MATGRKAKKPRRRLRKRGCLLAAIIFLIPVLMVMYVVTALFWNTIRELPGIRELNQYALHAPDRLFDVDVPENYIPLYKEAAAEYGIPWTLLAAHHRVETRFSTMDPLLSPAGAEGHMQFMPCTWVGWQHPTCSGLGAGDIPEEEKTDPEVIRKYGGYGVDADGDGKADPYSLKDAVYSAAAYLSENGAADGEIRQAVFRYNHSDKYVQDVLAFYEDYESRIDDFN
ncbi:lytic transglycosylase domain-containing protein [Edaphobacillus lindanitolerans]|uniref:Transglycosylase SLT domain-containing protein n=1 Tax=Edaphobacillus lindanitolerans TaxID=550447 RepID=A0A1U7PJB9_9BACI|nr:lytic transglycosylase domain-containing protein [Edaphobacillus lindanitolerans]SIT81117.1 Transglycosylase SLT domain-containing protein [Edaphobacillus lindanitolerans]